MPPIFSRNKKAAKSAQDCAACKKRYDDRQALVARARDRLKHESENHPDYIYSDEAEARAAADRFELYTDAAVHAKAATNVYDQKADAECLTNLSKDPDKVNADLGLPPGTLKASDFSD